MLSLSGEQRALLKLTLVNGLGPRLIRSLLDRFGSAEQAVQASANELSQVPYISDRLARDFRLALDHLDVDGEIVHMSQHGVQPVFLGEPDYPQALAKVPVSPLMLYIRGNLVRADNNAIAIVGSRQCTAYGRRLAERLAADLARAGWTIVSGLPRGTSLLITRSGRR